MDRKYGISAWSITLCVAIWWTCSAMCHAYAKIAVTGNDFMGIFLLTTAQLGCMLGGLNVFKCCSFYTRPPEKKGSPTYATTVLYPRDWIIGIFVYVGTLAMNTSFTLGSSISSLVVKMTEPTLALIASFVLEGKCYSIYVLLLQILVIGGITFPFVYFREQQKPEFSGWQILVALLSSICFVARSFMLKKITKGSSFTEYVNTIACVFSRGVILSAIVYATLLIWRLHDGLLHVHFDSFTHPVVYATSLSSAGFLFYNAASLTALFQISPLLHSLLKVSKRFTDVLGQVVFLGNIRYGYLSWLSLLLSLCATILSMYTVKNADKQDKRLLDTEETNVDDWVTRCWVTFRVGHRKLLMYALIGLALPGVTFVLVNLTFTRS